MDRSDSESGSEAVDISEPQDLFSNEADEEMPVAKENEAQEEQVQQKEKESEAEVKSKPKAKKIRCSSVLSCKTLTKPSGLPALKKLFEDFKFKGNGHEEEDLTRIMAVLQHWMCYQLCPSYDFETCMFELETLGRKRIVQTLMKKYRLGIDNWGERKPDDMDQNEKDDKVEICEPAKEKDFDLLLNEEVLDADNEGELSPKSKKIDPQQSTQKEVEITLTAEQLERIARNRKLAEERRMKRMSHQELTVNKEPACMKDSEIRPVGLDET